MSGPGRWLLFDEPHMGGLRALLAFGNLKLDGLPLLQRAVAGGLNRAEVAEDIRAAIDGVEAIALVRGELLDGSSGHGVVPPRSREVTSPMARGRHGRRVRRRSHLAAMAPNSAKRVRIILGEHRLVGKRPEGSRRRVERLELCPPQERRAWEQRGRWLDLRIPCHPV